MDYLFNLSYTDVSFVFVSVKFGILSACVV